MPSRPPKMDLSALGGLKRRVLQPVPEPTDEETAPSIDSAAQVAPLQDAPAPAPELEESGSEPVPPGTQGPGEKPQLGSPVAAATEPVAIKPVDEDHSGYVTLYLARELNKWLTEHHDSTGVSYPGIILNAISWAAADNRFAEIFAPEDSPIPANDIFGRAPAVSKLSRGQVDPEPRPVRFRKDHMRVIIGLARTWTADNRNAFFVGILSAYRDRDQPQQGQKADA